MRPYIVTTRRHPEDDGMGRSWFNTESRRAFSTLEEARAATVGIVGRRPRDDEALATLVEAAATLPESGGTVGPLPDGTVIGVERRTWEELAHDEAAEGWADELTGDPATPDAVAHTAIIAAYNAAQKAAA